jgi:hypothetical protein
VTSRDDLVVLKRIVGLRTQRLDLARREVAARASVVAECEEALRVRDEQIAAHDRAEAHVAAWFCDGMSGAAQLVDSSLARQDVIRDARAHDLELRDSEIVALDEARAAHAEAVQDLVRAQARLDVAEDQHRSARRGLNLAAEEREHAEYEDRTPAGGTSGRSYMGAL